MRPHKPMIGAALRRTAQPAVGLKLYSIQYLRAFAASAVVLSHAANSLFEGKEHHVKLDYGAYGVDIFFVVSGFIMFYTTYQTNIRPGSFLFKRFVRVFPLYFVLSTALFALVSMSPGSFNQESADPVAYVQSIFFIPHWNPRLHNLEPIVGPGWTLNYEMFFYLIFAMGLFIRHRLNGLIAIPVIATLFAIGRLYSGDSPAYIVYTNSLMIEFCLGLAVACAFIVPTRQSLHWPLALIVLFCLVTTYLYVCHADIYRSQVLRPLFIGIPSALLVTAAVLLERTGKIANIPLLAAVGDASYSLYLVHGFILGVAQRLWHRLHPVNSVPTDAVYVTLCLLTSIVAAFAVYRHVELRLGRRINAAARRLNTSQRTG